MSELPDDPNNAENNSDDAVEFQATLAESAQDTPDDQGAVVEFEGTVADMIATATTATPIERVERSDSVPLPRDGGGGGPIYDHGWTLPPGCPVEPLGVKDDVRFYLDAHGQFRALKADRHGRLNIFALFGGDGTAWLNAHFGRYNKAGELTGIKEHEVAYALMAEAARKGVYNPTGKLRGAGGWLGENRDLVFHCGDVVIVGGQEHRPGRIGEHVYPADEPGPRPLQYAAPKDDEATDDQRNPGKRLKSIFESWKWADAKVSPTLLLGWVVAAMAGGALLWRPMIWVTGERGTGKSTLLEGVVKTVLDGGLVVASDATAAGIWQKIGYASLPIAVDEAEAKDDPRRLQAVIELVRQAASGGLVLRGSGDHIGAEFVARSCFMFTSINVPPLTAADQSRISVLELDKLGQGDRPLLDPNDLANIGAGLRHRLVDYWPNLNDRLEVWHGALKDAGHDARGADLFGTLLACADLAQHDEAPTSDDLEAWGELLNRQALDARFDIKPDEALCASRLLSSHLDAYRDGRTRTVADWIETAKEELIGKKDIKPEQASSNDVLAQFGIKVLPTEDEKCAVAIANNHEALNRMFLNTRWQNGVWRQALGRFAETHTSNLKFAGYASRCIVVPLGQLIPEDTNGPEDGEEPHAPTH